MYPSISDHGFIGDLQSAALVAAAICDAALLLMPLMGFHPANDPGWQATLTAMDRRLVTDGLVHRDDPQTSPDGPPEDEGMSSLCTFLYVDALAQSSRLETPG